MAAVELSTVLIYLSIVLFSARVGGEIFSRLGQPPVVGELIAGFALGPFVAGNISQMLFGSVLFINMDSPAGEMIAIFGDIGIILLLFLAGISIDVEEFRRWGKPATIIAAAGVVVSFILGYGTAWVLGWNAIEAAFFGAVLTATSVGLTTRCLIDVNRLHTPVGMAIMEAAVIDDILGIIVLSVLSGVAFGSLTVVGLSEIIALIVAFVVIVLVLGFRALPKIMRFFGRFQVDEALVSLTLVIVFFISAMAQLVSLAAITGAFLAGLVMSRLPVAGSIRSKVSGIGYGLFIPMFFTEMGISMNFSELAGIGVVAGVLILVSAFLSKIIGCGGGALAGGFSLMDSLRIGIGMIPRAEVALVIAAIGIRSGIVGHALLSVTVLIVLVTSLVTPFLIRYSFRPTAGEIRSARKTLKPSSS
jgi:Kef-type K+ transport system membrane component KefB